MESARGTLTRNESKQLGLALGVTKPTETTCDYKLQDCSLLNECISKAATCQTYKRSTLRLQLWQNNKERCGLAESMFLKCSECGTETKLSSSRKFRGQGSLYKVSHRSAMVSETPGREKLSKLCSRMNLPPPITS